MVKKLLIILMFLFCGCSIHIDKKCECENLENKTTFPQGSWKYEPDDCNTCICEGHVCSCTLLGCGGEVNK